MFKRETWSVCFFVGEGRGTPPQKPPWLRHSKDMAAKHFIFNNWVSSHNWSRKSHCCKRKLRGQLSICAPWAHKDGGKFSTIFGSGEERIKSMHKKFVKCHSKVLCSSLKQKTSENKMRKNKGILSDLGWVKRLWSETSLVEAIVRRESNYRVFDTNIARRLQTWWRVNVIMVSRKRYGWPASWRLFTEQRVARTARSKGLSVHRLVQVSSVVVLPRLAGGAGGSEAAGSRVSRAGNGRVLALASLPLVPLSNCGGTWPTGGRAERFSGWRRWGIWRSGLTRRCKFCLGKDSLATWKERQNRIPKVYFVLHRWKTNWSYLSLLFKCESHSFHWECPHFQATSVEPIALRIEICRRKLTWRWGYVIGGLVPVHGGHWTSLRLVARSRLLHQAQQKQLVPALLQTPQGISEVIQKGNKISEKMF